MTERETAGNTFRVLIVCTGNLCRSPVAEYLLRAQFIDRIADNIVVEISSAGTQAQPGQPIDELAGHELRRLGCDASGFRSRVFDDRMATEADLVLTATREQRSLILEREPRAMQRTFTMLEFAQLVGLLRQGDSTTSEPGELVRKAGVNRWRVTLDDYDIADPRGQSSDVHRATAENIRTAMVAIAAGLNESSETS